MKIIVEIISDAIVPQNIMLGSTRDERLVERRFHGNFHITVSQDVVSHIQYNRVGPFGGGEGGCRHLLVSGSEMAATKQNGGRNRKLCILGTFSYTVCGLQTQES